MSKYWSLLANQKSISFIFKIDTTLTSSSTSANNQYFLPLGGGTYDFVIKWGDGTEDRITSNLQTERLHTYPEPGEYLITMTGVISNITHNTGESLDNVKIKQVYNFGTATTNGYMFYSCLNADFSEVSDMPLIGTATISYILYGVNGIIKNIDKWDTSAAQSTNGSFVGSNFNQDITNWDVTNVVDMNYMFYYAYSFNQDISKWNFNKEVYFGPSFLAGAGSFSTDNYDKFLIKLASIDWTGRVAAKELGSSSKYSSAAVAARAALVADGWSITDEGMV